MFALRSLPLDGRIASFLLAAGAANGLVFRVVEAWKEQGADAAFGFFGVSPIELVVIGVAAKLLFEARNLSGGASANAAAALFALCVVWPSSLLAWPLTASFALFAALRTWGPARAGALLFAALAFWEVWSTVAGAEPGVEMGPRGGRPRWPPVTLSFSQRRYPLRRCHRTKRWSSDWFSWSGVRRRTSFRSPYWARRR